MVRASYGSCEEGGRRFSVRLGAAWAVCFTMSASAQPAHGHYESTFKDSTGVVKAGHVVPPHSWVYSEVKDPKGEPQLWALEATGRPQLERAGVNKAYIKAGDTIKARCHQLRDGTNGCLLGFLKAADGTV